MGPESKGVNLTTFLAKMAPEPTGINLATFTQMWTATVWLLCWDGIFILLLAIFSLVSRHTPVCRFHFWIVAILAIINVILLITTFSNWHQINSGVVQIAALDDPRGELMSTEFKKCVGALVVIAVAACLGLLYRLCMRRPIKKNMVDYRPRLWQGITCVMVNCVWLFTLNELPLRQGVKLFMGDEPITDKKFEKMLVKPLLPLLIVSMIFAGGLVWPWYEGFIQAWYLYFVPPGPEEPPKPYPKGHHLYRRESSLATTDLESGNSTGSSRPESVVSSETEYQPPTENTARPVEQQTYYQQLEARERDSILSTDFTPANPRYPHTTLFAQLERRDRRAAALAAARTNPYRARPPKVYILPRRHVEQARRTPDNDDDKWDPSIPREWLRHLRRPGALLLRGSGDRAAGWAR